MRYVGLLRAVNVGKRKVPMAKLRELCEGLGHTEVETLLQSGNVVFTAKKPDPAGLAKALEAEFGFAVPVVVRTGRQLQAVIDANPFAREATADGKAVHVAFASGPVKAKLLDAMDRERFAPDEFAAGKDVVYLHYPNGSGRSKMTIQHFEKPLGLDLTARNWNTVVKLRELAG
jgi:uncharacterized protein (DUF1697 family)